MEHALSPLAGLSRDWCSQAASSVLQGYEDLAREVLVQAAATQKFIQSRGGSTTSGMTRIVAQFRLDSNRLLQILADRHGVELPELAAKLREIIKE
jgi:phage shock protein A